MRIGQVAALLGVSTRTIRHYHHMGVLPEPEREPNGYRRYTLRDLVILARARRLTELGLSLAEVTDAVADDRGADLVEILRELDADLEQQESSIRETRRRLSELQERADQGQDVFTPPAVSAFFEAMAAHADSPSVALDRSLMSLVPDVALQEMADLFADPDGASPDHARVLGLYEQMDALADAQGDDPRAVSLAVQIVEGIPSGSRAELRRLTAGGGEPVPEVMAAILSAGQLAVVRHVLRLLSEDS